MGKHKDKLLTPFSEHQVDMKIMYYELIKMLMDHDRDQMSEEEFSVTKTVHKIEGYQQLTNKLQRYMNLKFEGAITDITQKYDKIMNSIGKDGNGIFMAGQPFDTLLFRPKGITKIHSLGGGGFQGLVHNLGQTSFWAQKFTSQS